LVVLLVACGGSAARSSKPSPSASGAAGDVASVAGSPNLPASAGGAAGTSAGGAGGVLALAGAEASDAGAGGQPTAPACLGLDCLANAELLYLPDREWQRTAAASGTGELLEADYTPVLGPTWHAKFSSNALAVDLTPTAGGDTVHGTRDAKRTDRAWFELSLFAGGRFVVQASSGELQAEYTIYGSGAPIVSSTRGLVQNP
jgi:hypothetical protein